MRKLMPAIAFAMLLGTAAAHATCPNQVGSLSLGVGQTSHVTMLTASPSCAQIGPAGVTVSNPTHSSILSDGTTGWNITANVVGSDTVTFTPPAGSNEAAVQMIVSVTATPTVMTSP